MVGLPYMINYYFKRFIAWKVKFYMNLTSIFLDLREKVRKVSKNLDLSPK